MNNTNALLRINNVDSELNLNLIFCSEDRKSDQSNFALAHLVISMDFESSVEYYLNGKPGELELNRSKV